MEQRLIVPYGTDPVVVSQTVLTNRGDKPLELSYYEVWGGSMWQLTSLDDSSQSAGQRRAFQNAHYTSTVTPLQT